MKPGGLPLGITWTYDGATWWRPPIGRRRACHRDPERRLPARLVAGVPRPAPSSAGLHPSAFAWLNAKGHSNPVDADVEPGGSASSRPDAIRFSWCSMDRPNGSTRPVASYLRIDHGRDADREPEPGNDWDSDPRAPHPASEESLHDTSRRTRRPEGHTGTAGRSSTGSPAVSAFQVKERLWGCSGLTARASRR